MHKWLKKYRWLLFILPGFIGICCFYLVPHLTIFRYTFISDKITGAFGNFIELFQNDAYLLAVKNTTLMALFGTIITIPCALIVAIGIRRFRFKDISESLLLIPLAVPSAVVAILCQLIHAEKINCPLILILIIYLWKYIGYYVVIFSESLNEVPVSIQEAAKLEGAGSFQLFKKITLPLIQSSILFCTLISVMNSFRMFREVYLLYGNHPKPDVYLMSHFINNAIGSLNYPKMSAAAVVMEIGILLLTVLFLKIDKKTQEDLY